MHRYQPRIHLIMRKDGSNSQITDLENELYRTFVFPENIFIAVTAYQNQLVSTPFKRVPFPTFLHLTPEWFRVDVGLSFFYFQIGDPFKRLVKEETS